MASLRYLFFNRAKFPILSVNFYRAWGKRLFSLPEVIRRNYRRWKLINNGATIHETAEIGDVIVDGNKSKLTIGSFTFLGKVNMALHEEIIIGARVCINDGVRIFTASHDINDPAWSHKKGKVIIDDYAWIGTGAMILPGVHIGRGAVVGAGAVVSKSVISGSVVVGNPARPISKVRSKELNYNPCEFLAGNRAWLIG